MKELIISLAPFLNTKVFTYGLRHSGLVKNLKLIHEAPSASAQRVLAGGADIALVPVAVIPELKKFQIITNWCIGSNNSVESVIIAGNSPVRQIKKIHLDARSRTSVLLAKIIAGKFWKIKVVWKPGKKISLKKNIPGESFLFIGDKALKLKAGFRHVYDLSNEWKKYTGLPFVFACWVARSDISRKKLKLFDEALGWGAKNIQKVIAGNQPSYRWVDVSRYLTKSISYKLDTKKISAMNLFWKYLREMETPDL